MVSIVPTVTMCTCSINENKQTDLQGKYEKKLQTYTSPLMWVSWKAQHIWEISLSGLWWCILGRWQLCHCPNASGPTYVLNIFHFLSQPFAFFHNYTVEFLKKGSDCYDTKANLSFWNAAGSWTYKDSEHGSTERMVLFLLLFNSNVWMAPVLQPSWLHQYFVFTLQVIDVIIGTDDHGRRAPKYLIHFNGWNRRYELLFLLSFLLNPVILIVVFTLKSYPFTIDPVKAVGHSYQDLQGLCGFYFLLFANVCVFG